MDEPHRRSRMALDSPATSRIGSPWDTFPRLPQLARDEVAVLQLQLDRLDLTPFSSVLEDDEQRRADRFVHEVQRRRFVNAHSATPLILGSCLGLPPQCVRFTRAEGGKPRLPGGGELQFNLSHSADLALLALARGRSVGIDVEQHQAVDVLGLSSRFFAPPEHEKIRSLPPEEQESAFFRCWTRKEAFVKALGCGLSMSLDAFAVDLGPAPTAQALRSCSADPAAVRRWRVIGIPTCEGYSAALAARGQHWRISTWSEPRLELIREAKHEGPRGRDRRTEPCGSSPVTTLVDQDPGGEYD